MSTTAAVLALAVAGFACVHPDDPEQRRWFQSEPCAQPMRHDPLPAAPFVREFPGVGVDATWEIGTPAGETTRVRWKRQDRWIRVSPNDKFIVIRHSNGTGRTVRPGR
jgi:hypothetical protein